MNTKLATILTVSGIGLGVITGGTLPTIILLSSGLGVSVAEIINTLK